MIVVTTATVAALSALAALLLPCCAGAQAPGWPPMMDYRLGPGPAAGPLEAPKTNGAATGTQEEITVIGRRLAPQSAIRPPVTNTPQAVFNVGGNPFRAPANCPTMTTTVGGQPARTGDLVGQVGVRGCYF